MEPLGPRRGRARVGSGVSVGEPTVGSFSYTVQGRQGFSRLGRSYLVAEGDRIFESHAAWMAQSHHREGDKALLAYNIVKGPELSNPLDPSSEPTGKTSFVLTEVYQSQAGVEDHWKQGTAGWGDFGALAEWAPGCEVTTLQGSPIIHSLW